STTLPEDRPAPATAACPASGALLVLRVRYTRPPGWRRRTPHRYRVPLRGLPARPAFVLAATGGSARLGSRRRPSSLPPDQQPAGYASPDGCWHRVGSRYAVAAAWPHARQGSRVRGSGQG